MLETAILDMPGVAFSPLNHVSFSPDGTFLAASSVDREVAVFRGSEIVYQSNFQTEDHRLRPLDSVRSLVFSADSQFLYVAAGDMLRRISLYNGTEQWARQADPNMVFLITTPVALARSGLGQVACAYADGRVELYNCAGELERSWTHNSSPCLIGYLSGNRLVGTDRFTIGVWNSSGKLVDKAKGTQRMFALAASEVSDLVAVRSLHEVLILRTSDWQPVGRSGTKAGYPKLEFISGDQLVSLDLTGFAILDDKGAEVRRVDTPLYRPIGLNYSPLHGLAVSGSDGAVHIYPM